MTHEPRQHSAGQRAQTAFCSDDRMTDDREQIVEQPPSGTVNAIGPRAPSERCPAAQRPEPASQNLAAAAKGRRKPGFAGSPYGSTQRPSAVQRHQEQQRHPSGAAATSSCVKFGACGPTERYRSDDPTCEPTQPILHGLPQRRKVETVVHLHAQRPALRVVASDAVVRGIGHERGSIAARLRQRLSELHQFVKVGRFLNDEQHATATIDRDRIGGTSVVVHRHPWLPRGPRPVRAAAAFAAPGSVSGARCNTRPRSRSSGAGIAPPATPANDQASGEPTTSRRYS